MAWLILVIAGVLEICWAAGLKHTAGFTRLWPTVGTVIAMAASVALLGVSVRTLPLGTAYAVWTGIGTVGAALVGILAFGEAATFSRCPARGHSRSAEHCVDCRLPHSGTTRHARRSRDRSAQGMSRLGNHPVCGFGAATPPNLGGDTLTCSTFISPRQ
jgi:quaternary ammonium compound-resistance protein SugE